MTRVTTFWRATVTALYSVVTWLRALIPASKRESFYRGVSGVVTALFGLGVISGQEATLWTQQGISTVTLLFALLHSTSKWRTALYLVIVAAGPLLALYGWSTEETWALVVGAAAQLLGITTAAAKTIQVGDQPSTTLPEPTTDP
ncbi:hypothetical protein AKOMA_17 [Mycobacterium phage Akoma]|uniref:Holin n=1 Tax=Mycobacterium phage Bernardo TaxID=1429903 RepID=V5RBH7_9CAUD|nr:holin [Mycobacterium phage Bernardo]YP_009018527.1 holin [Mycobacterium phage Akoma]AER48827.1 hypothetical protein AKOMA_17 [Mycobacterium phage Akoma]AHB31694.1 hypothetical protein PBI_BERNARDO_17 [Mycobacterium phage Bernardo]